MGSVGLNTSFTYSFSTLAQEQKSVELLEQDGGRLMDGTKDSLTIVGQFAKECTDRPRTLRVKTTSRFVKEQKQLRLDNLQINPTVKSKKKY